MSILKAYKAKRLLKNYRHFLYAGVGWLIFLILFFSLKQLIRPRYYIHIRLDDYIPFVKWFFPAYCSWYVYLFAALLYFGLRSKPDFIKLQTYLFAGMGICLIVFIIFPNAIRFRPVILQKDLISRAMVAMFSIDSSTMVIPSMHVFDAVAVHLSLMKSGLTGRNRLLLTLSFILVALISASTVFVKQHSVLDVLCGIALAVVLYFPVYGFKKAAPH
jgi:PAP2 superfamily.